MPRCIDALIRYRIPGATRLVLAATISFAVPWTAPALAQNPVLRDIETRSFLGEPLNLRIALAASTERDTGAICQSVIDSDRRENALRSSDLILTMVELRNTRYLQVRSRAAFNEPVARFSLRIGCPGEPVVDREFTALIDPPPFIALPASTTSPSTASPRSIVKDASGDAPLPVKSARPSPRAKPVIPVSGSWTSVKGDSLTTLAKAIYPRNRARQQQYIEVLRELNPQLAPLADEAPLAPGTQLALPDLQTLSGIMPRATVALPVPAPAAPLSVAPAQVKKTPAAAKALPRPAPDTVVKPSAVSPSPPTPSTPSTPPESKASSPPAKVAATQAVPRQQIERGGSFQLRLSGAQMDLTRSNNVTNEQRNVLREKQLILDSDDQVAALLSLRNTVKQLEQRLNEIQLKTSTTTAAPLAAATAPSPPSSPSAAAPSSKSPAPSSPSAPQAAPAAPAPAAPPVATTKTVESAAPPAPAKSVDTPTIAPEKTAAPIEKPSMPLKSGKPISPAPSSIDTVASYLPSPLVAVGILAGLIALLGAWAWSRRKPKPRISNSDMPADAGAMVAAAPASQLNPEEEHVPDKAFANWAAMQASAPAGTQPDSPARGEHDGVAEHPAHSQVDAPVVFDDTPASYELDSNPATTVDFLVGMDEKLPEDRVRRLQYMHERYPELKTNTVSIDDADSVINAARLYYDESDKGNGADKACELLTFAVEERPQQVRYWLAQFEIFRLENRVAEFSALASKFHVLFSHTPSWPKVRHIGHELDPGNTLFAGGIAPLANESRFDPIAENWLNAPMDFTSDALMSDLRQALLDDHHVRRADFESITARLTASAA